MSENKYPWLEFDEQSAAIEQDKRHRDIDDFIHGSRYQHSKDKAIMLKLLEIIEMQREALKYYSNEINNSYSAVMAFAKTEQMLKELE
jgi:hypothetical protein